MVGPPNRIKFWKSPVHLQGESSSHLVHLQQGKSSCLQILFHVHPAKARDKVLVHLNSSPPEQTLGKALDSIQFHVHLAKARSKVHVTSSIQVHQHKHWVKVLVKHRFGLRIKGSSLNTHLCQCLGIQNTKVQQMPAIQRISEKDNSSISRPP